MFNTQTFAHFQKNEYLCMQIGISETYDMKTIFIKPLQPTMKTASWLLRLMVAISLAVALLQHFGVIGWVAQYLNPVFVRLGLPGSSSIIFISGAMAGTYAGIAAMASIQLTMRQATIVGLMIALCHALPMECSVNKKTGSPFWRMGLIRIVMAFICAVYLNALLPEMNDPYVYIGAAQNSTLTEVLTTWCISQLKMAVMVVVIIYLLMVVQQLIEVYNLLPKISRFLSPLMRLFGLPTEAAYMWLVGNVLGISYGSAVMIDLEERGLITKEEARETNYHLIMNHSLLEDTIVFVLTGISAFWIVSTRVLFALLIVWGRKVCKSILP